MKRAFTLIELLTAIAIIAILAAILFPVFSRAKQAAKSSACLSNIRQLNQGLSLYTDDNNGEFPGDNIQEPINGGIDQNVTWDMLIMPYVKNDDVFHCPTDTVVRKNRNVWNGKYQDLKKPRSYGITNQIVTLMNLNGTDKNTGVFGSNESTISSSSETITFVESYSTFVSDGVALNDSVISGTAGSTFYFCDAWKLPRTRQQLPDEKIVKACPDFNDKTLIQATGHFDRGNYAFADGHVKNHAFPEVIASDFRLFKRKK